MSKNSRAILRDADGEFVKHLSAEEIEVYNFYAERGEVIRSIQTRKGLNRIVFRLKVPEIPTFEPSNSRDTACSLTPSDMDGLAGMTFSEARTSRFLLERWAGYGLLGATS